MSSLADELAQIGLARTLKSIYQRIDELEAKVAELESREQEQ